MNGFHRAAAVLHADHFAGQLRFGRDGRLVGHHDDLAVFQVGLGEQDVGLALFGNRQAVPQHVDALAVELGFLGAPVDRLEAHVNAQAFAGLFGQIDVKADQLVFVITKTHRREVVVQADDDGFDRHRGRCCRNRLFLFAAARHDESSHQARDQPQSVFFHLFFQL